MIDSGDTYESLTQEKLENEYLSPVLLCLDGPANKPFIDENHEYAYDLKPCEKPRFKLAKQKEIFIEFLCRRGGKKVLSETIENYRRKISKFVGSKSNFLTEIEKNKIKEFEKGLDIGTNLLQSAPVFHAQMSEKSQDSWTKVLHEQWQSFFEACSDSRRGATASSTRRSSGSGSTLGRNFVSHDGSNYPPGSMNVASLPPKRKNHKQI